MTKQAESWSFLAEALTSFRTRKDALDAKPIGPLNHKETRILTLIIRDLEELVALYKKHLFCPHGRPRSHMCSRCVDSA